MRQDFAKDLARVLKSEGGYVNHPDDPGGKTNKGITQRVYAAWLRKQKLPQADVRNIKPEHVAAIYKAEYWDKVAGDQLPTGVCYVVFDCAVNSGVSRGVLWLQLALGTVRADGAMGPATLKGVDDYPDHDELIAKIIALRLNFVRHLKTYKTFGRGWERRYAQVRATGQAEATGLDSVPPVTFAALGNGKANYEDAKDPPPTKVASTVATGAGSGGVASQAVDSAASYSWVPFLSKVIPIATALLFIAAAAAGAYLLWASKKRHALEEALNIHRPPVQVANDNAEVDDGEDDDTAMAVHLAGTISGQQEAA